MHRAASGEAGDLVLSRGLTLTWHFLSIASREPGGNGHCRRIGNSVLLFFKSTMRNCWVKMTVKPDARLPASNPHTLRNTQA